MGERDAISDGQGVRANAQSDISPVEIFSGSSMLTAGPQGNSLDATSISPPGTNSFQFDKDGSVTTPVSARHLDRNFTTAGPGLADVEVYAIKKKK